MARNAALAMCAIGLTTITAGGMSPPWPAWLLGALSVGVTIFVYLALETLTTVATTAAQRRAAAVGNL